MSDLFLLVFIDWLWDFLPWNLKLIDKLQIWGFEPFIFRSKFRFLTFLERFNKRFFFFFLPTVNHGGQNFLLSHHTIKRFSAGLSHIRLNTFCIRINAHNKKAITKKRKFFKTIYKRLIRQLQNVFQIPVKNSAVQYLYQWKFSIKNIKCVV